MSPTPGAARRRCPRVLAGCVAVVLGLAMLAGCGDDHVDCATDACTVTLERSVDASAEVLGVRARFVRADGDTVTVEVAGKQLPLRVGQPAVQAGGLRVSLDRVTTTEVVIRVAH